MHPAESNPPATPGETSKPGCSWLIGGAVGLLAIGVLCGILSPLLVDKTAPTPLQAKSEINSLANGIRAYVAEYGNLPTSDPAGIVRALTGENPKHFLYLELTPKQRSPEGFFIDPWGTPYRIDVSNPRNPRIFSAGKNRRDEPNDPLSDDIRSWQ